jgi:energy-coupling factor transporter ATP-binding protein EcfA2
MLTKIAIRNFKTFENVELELGERVVLVGPNNSGKSSVLQAIALWSVGVKRWVEKHGAEDAPQKRPGATINRRDLIALPIPAADLLWRNLRVREGEKLDDVTRTKNVLIEIIVEGVDAGENWAAALEFDYANKESFYCRSKISEDGKRRAVPVHASDLKVAYLPPMSGLVSNETRLDEGAINVRIGEGRTAEVLRNLCWSVHQRSPQEWAQIVEQMNQLFGVKIDEPKYVQERGEIVMSFKNSAEVRLDLSASGRGQQQTLLLLAHMAANPGSLLLLDEPDAHLEFLRQRQIYQILTDAATRSKSQIIAASHSEVLLNEAADRDIVIAFVGRPHRIDDRGSQVLKALKEIGFDQYVQAEERGWVLYLEGSTDLAILRSFASLLNHPAGAALESPFVHYVGNKPAQAKSHFYALREAKNDLRAIAIYDRLDAGLQPNPDIIQHQWARREIENYLSQRDTLLRFAESRGRDQHGDLFATTWKAQMEISISEVETALRTLGRPDPWGPDSKVSDEFLGPLFQKFYAAFGLPNFLRKTDFHVLAPFVEPKAIDDEIIQVLDKILQVATS